MGHETLLLTAPPTTTLVNHPLSVSVPSASATAAPPTSLAPGFRFHPTDEELVIYYLKRKFFGKPFRFDAIAEVDIYKSEPWDLSGCSFSPKFLIFINFGMIKIEFLLLLVCGVVLFRLATMGVG